MLLYNTDLYNVVFSEENDVFLAERLVFNHVYQFVYPKINSAQRGFIKNRSTTSQLIDTYSSIITALDAGGQIIII